MLTGSPVLLCNRQHPSEGASASKPSSFALALQQCMLCLVWQALILQAACTTHFQSGLLGSGPCCADSTAALSVPGACFSATVVTLWCARVGDLRCPRSHARVAAAVQCDSPASASSAGLKVCWLCWLAGFATNTSSHVGLVGAFYMTRQPQLNLPACS
jgi:hypothetical protein